MSNGVLAGNLVLVASGDFSFGLRDQPDGTLAFNSFPEIDHNYADTGFPGAAVVKGSDPLAALDKLAADIRKAGITEIDGNVAIDDRLFDTYSEWNDGLISPIWVNENVIDITTTPTSPGEPATIDWRPKTAAITVEGEVKTVSGDADADHRRDRRTWRRQGERRDRGRKPAHPRHLAYPRPGVVRAHRFHRGAGARRRDGQGRGQRAEPDGHPPRRRQLYGRDQGG